jgi:hypothetical protein
MLLIGLHEFDRNRGGLRDTSDQLQLHPELHQ